MENLRLNAPLLYAFHGAEMDIRVRIIRINNHRHSLLYYYYIIILLLLLLQGRGN